MDLNPKTVGLVFIDRYADWEHGLLAASAVEWFGARVLALTPGGGVVASAAGLRVAGDRGLEPAANVDLDAVAVIGSDVWPTPDAPDVSKLLSSVSARGGIVGGICAGTLALARAGLFAEVRHTSNGRKWILEHLPAYPGASQYHDVPHAVADGKIVSAPGNAPGTFAHRFLLALYPEREAQLSDMLAMFAKEYGSRQSS
ncbi:DJ-1/PfpI family protein [Pseudorhodoplanes sp.]|uniref:DJ-1/PfpI family protein n=1 Tax=Pseudorhodoplanes sp. TaxID=1934341 RepID=UPI002C4F5679|nr:DJ-1/PfpI family protein [Pseudorhodoplanes sp.]HWK63819.1 DJ-1/PfpI family protein [Rhizobiaceae bacterium]HWV41060.1 DJ-1/PfpI family protein [Pseudorhodoplanes sp.]